MGSRHWPRTGWDSLPEFHHLYFKYEVKLTLAVLSGVAAREAVSSCGVLA